MEKTNKIYITNYKGLNKSICFFYYSLEEAIECGMSQFTDDFYEEYDRKPFNTGELETFINDKLKDDIFLINVISGNRLRFKTTKELIHYFLDNIDNVDNDNLYDFLLSFVECQDLFYNYKGECLNSSITTQCPSDEYAWDHKISFTEESCKEGKYKFICNILGEPECLGRDTF